VRFGLSVQNFGPYGDPRLLADLARDGEAVGWEGFFVWDHLLRGDAPVADPWISLASIAVAGLRPSEASDLGLLRANSAALATMEKIFSGPRFLCLDPF